MSNPIINRLLEVQEGDERSMDFYLTGLLQPISGPFVNLRENSKLESAISENDVKRLIKTILTANYRHIEMLQISSPKNEFTDGLD